MILRPSAALAKAVSAGSGARVLARSGVVKPFSPVVLARLAKAMYDWGLVPPAASPCSPRATPTGSASWTSVAS
jgi:hypothetical protein